MNVDVLLRCTMEQGLSQHDNVKFLDLSGLEDGIGRVKCMIGGLKRSVHFIRRVAWASNQHNGLDAKIIIRGKPHQPKKLFNKNWINRLTLDSPQVQQLL